MFRVFRQHWVLVLFVGLFVLLEFAAMVYDGNPAEIPVFLTSLVVAASALLAAHRPGLAIWLAAAGMSAAGALVWTLGLIDAYNLPPGVPVSQVVSGMAVAAALVRRASLRWAGIGVAVLSVVVSGVVLLNVTRRWAGWEYLGFVALGGVLVLGMAVAVGFAQRARDTARANQVAAAVAQARSAERLDLARELHDVVAHHVTGIVVQAQAARVVAAANPSAAATALARIEDSGTEALAAMRRLVGGMRAGRPPGAASREHATTDLVADLRELVDQRRYGVSTSLQVDLAHPVPPDVARSALRLVQEALTNVGKHARGASTATVHAASTDTELHIEVVDNGLGSRELPTGGSGGFGLIGMAERVDLLQGRFHAGPVPDGWRVEAWLPL